MGICVKCPPKHQSYPSDDNDRPRQGSIKALAQSIPLAYNFHCSYHHHEACGGGQGKKPLTGLWLYNKLSDCSNMRHINTEISKHLSHLQASPRDGAEMGTWLDRPKPRAQAGGLPAPRATCPIADHYTAGLRPLFQRSRPVAGGNPADFSGIG